MNFHTFLHHMSFSILLENILISNGWDMYFACKQKSRKENTENHHKLVTGHYLVVAPTVFILRDKTDQIKYGLGSNMNILT